MLLAINTATNQTEIALLKKTKLIAEESWASNRDQAEKTYPQIIKLLEKNSLELKQIRQILVVTGPGSFSAVRVGVTIANTLAFALKAEIFGLDTFELFHLKAKPFCGNAPLHIFLSAGGQNSVLKTYNYLSLRAQRKDVSLRRSKATEAIPLFFHGIASAGACPEQGERGLAMTSPDSAKHIGLIGDLINKSTVNFDQPAFFTGEIANSDLEKFQKQTGWEYLPPETLQTFGQVIEKITLESLKSSKTIQPTYLLPPNITKPKKSKAKTK